jgi:hypothetical protein
MPLPASRWLPAPLRTALLTGLLSAAPGLAFAGSVAVPPLVSSGVDAKQTHNLTSLIASELDFMAEFEGSKHLTKKPAGFGASCLASGGCLGKVASGAGSTATVAGAVSRKGSTLDFYLVYAEGSSIVRTKEFSLEDSPSSVADGMTGAVRALVTGQSPKAAAAAASGKVDDDAFEDPYDDDESFIVAPPVSRRIPTDSDGSRSNELDDFEFDPEEERRKAEEEERARIAAVEARERQEAEARRQREAEEEERRRAALLVARQEEEAQDEEDDFDDFDLSFGGGVVSVDEAKDEDEEDDRSGAFVAAPPPPRSSRSNSSSRDSSPRSSSSRSDRGGGYDDLDSSPSRDRGSERDRSSSRDRGTAGRSGSDRGSRDSSEDVSPRVTLTPHIGYSYFQSFNFLTYGAELGVLPTENLQILAGIDVYSTRRAVPIELQEQGYPPYTWNSILPFNFGAVYKFSGKVRPYVGGDVLLIPGLVQGEGGLGTGLRVRGGVDIYFTDNLGINFNAAAGFLAGKSLEAVNPEAGTSGLTPQITTGLVLAF